VGRLLLAGVALAALGLGAHDTDAQDNGPSPVGRVTLQLSATYTRHATIAYTSPPQTGTDCCSARNGHDDVTVNVQGTAVYRVLSFDEGTVLDGLPGLDLVAESENFTYTVGGSGELKETNPQGCFVLGGPTSTVTNSRTTLTSYTGQGTASTGGTLVHLSLKTGQYRLYPVLSYRFTQHDEISGTAGCDNKAYTQSPLDFSGSGGIDDGLRNDPWTQLLQQARGTFPPDTEFTAPGSASTSGTSTSVDQSTQYQLVISSYTLSFQAAPVTIKIVDPGPDAVFLFGGPSGMPTAGHLLIPVRAEVTPPQLASEVAWDMDDIKGSTRKVDPDPGAVATVTFDTLPQRGDQFGRKTITAKVRGQRDQVTIRVFYFRDATDNPDGTVPNWFYYWKQTSAGQGHGDAIVYGGGKDFCKDTLGMFRGYHDASQAGVIYVCDLGAKSFRGYNLVLKTCQEGIDLFATTVVHEWKHKTDFERWWGPNGVHPGKFLDDAFDGDGDLIPDDVEPTLTPPADPHITCSLWPGLQDSHYYPYAEEAKWPPGTADEEDWGCPGRQCGGP